MEGSVSFYDEVDAEGKSSPSMPKKPIWAMDLDDPDNEKNVLDWLNGDLQHLQSRQEERHRQLHRNLALNKGIQYLDQERGDIRERGQERNQPVRKIVANHLFDLVQNRVSRLIKFKPAVAILPTNDELSDDVASKETKALLDHIWYTQNFEGHLTPAYAKHTAILGESYMFITWNPDKGDLHPDYKDLSKKGKVPLLDENGTQQKDSAGNPVYIDRPVRVGDVELELELATNVWLEIADSFDHAGYCYRRKIMPVERARLLYPKKASQIKDGDQQMVYDYNKMEMVNGKGMAIIHTFHHKKMIGMDKGREIVFTRDAILSNKEFPYDHERLPFVRLTDIDLPGEVHGKPAIDNIKALTGTYNNMLNMVNRNQVLASHPKWMVPAGSVKLDSLGNDATLVQFKGPQPPVLAQANPTGAETFNYMAMVKEDFQQIYGVFGVSRGEPPAGIKAGIALQFLAEQENERFNESVLKYNEAIRQIAIMTLSVAGTYYDSSDQRMIRILGKNNQWMTSFFDVVNLSKDYDIRIQNSSALPQSKAARTDYLLTIQERFPDRFTADQFLDMLDLAQSDKFIDAATINVRLAEAENEMITTKGQQMSPEEAEDHIVHWKIHVREMQSYGYKFQMPQDRKDFMKDHVMAHEMFMTEFAMKNPMYAQKVAILDGFPLFYKPTPMAQPMAPQMAPEQMGMAPPMAPGLPGQEQGLPINEPPPAVNEQIAGEPAVPQVGGAVEPTGAI